MYNYINNIKCYYKVWRRGRENHPSKLFFLPLYFFTSILLKPQKICLSMKEWRVILRSRRVTPKVTPATFIIIYSQTFTITQVKQSSNFVKLPPSKISHLLKNLRSSGIHQFNLNTYRKPSETPTHHPLNTSFFFSCDGR